MRLDRLPVTSHTLKLLAAFFAVYIIWGSTFLAVHFALASLPPFLLAGIRFTIAGSILLLWASSQRGPAPTRAQWKAMAVVGMCLMLCGNGAVAWAQQRMPSGLAALMVAVVPLWIALLDWLVYRSPRPQGPVLVGLLAGFSGLALLIRPGNMGGAAVDVVAAGVLMTGGLAWAFGTLYARDAAMPRSPLMATGMQMVVGGLCLLGVSGVTGEWGHVQAATMTTQSLLSMAYLILFPGVLGFSAYTWLLQNTTAARASTYAYVNPVVAVFLGWALAGEALTPRTVAATVVIIAAVALITRYGSSRRALKRATAPAPPSTAETQPEPMG